MNPCPCGHYDEAQRCRYTALEVRRYLSNLSGPFLDRIDLQVDVPPLPKAELFEAPKADELCIADVRAHVAKARAKQLSRSGVANAQLGNRLLSEVAVLRKDDQAVLEQAIDRLGLSARATHRILRVARTIADLADSPRVECPHLLEALSYRKLDRLHQGLAKM